MSKPTLLFRGPVKTLSGYGSHSRDLLKSLFDMDLFDIYIDSSNWGSTPMTALEPENNLFHLWIEENVISQSISQPDIYVQVTVPNEFQRVGKYNIGITAGIETTVAAKSWIDGCNRMDKVITTSMFSRDVLLQTVYNENDKGKYDWHIDTNFFNNNFTQRKLSIVLQLSDPTDYEGGQLELDVHTYGVKLANDFKKYVNQKGTVIVFPSFIRHRVTPVTKGIRKSLITWVTGANFR